MGAVSRVIGLLPRPSAPARTDGRVGVLYVHTPTAPPLGADVWVHARIMACLDRDTHEVHAACAFGPAGSPTPTQRELGAIGDLPLHRVQLGPELSGGSRRDKLVALVRTVPAPVSLARLAWLVRRRRLDIVATSDRPRDALACVVLGRLTGARSVVHVHVAWGTWMSPMLKWSLRNADALVGVSRFVAGTLVASGHDPDRTHAVLNGVDVARWEPGVGRVATRRSLGIADTTPVILTVCRLFPGKGVADLARALAVVRERHPDALLLVAGRETQPGHLAELERLVRDLGLGEHVRFLGLRDDVPALMAAADVYAMPSLGEPFGLVFAEAMAMELPVVALDSGGAPEVVEHGHTGLLAPEGDVAALAEHLAALVGDPELRRTMGAEGRKRVESQFTTDRVARDVGTVYRRILARSAAPEHRRAAPWSS
jgi:glycosyltransferase involved in cell wall biosynthesis